MLFGGGRISIGCFRILCRFVWVLRYVVFHITKIECDMRIMFNLDMKSTR